MRAFRILTLLAVLAAVGIGAGCGGDDDDDGGETTPAATTTETGGGGGGGQTVEMSEYEFAPNDLTVEQGGSIETENVGTIEHNLTIEEGTNAEKASKELTGTPDVESGETAVLNVDVDPGQYSIVCTIPGHRELGMIGSITVE